MRLGCDLDTDTRSVVAHPPGYAARSLHHHAKEKAMSLGTILLIVLVLMLFGALPTWGHSRSWGYAPSGGLGLVLVVVVVLVLMGRL